MKFLYNGMRSVYMRFVYFSLLCRNKKYYDSASYYPEYKQRSKWAIFADQFSSILTHGCFNEHYFVYGMDVKEKSVREDYLLYIDFAKKRDLMNRRLFGRGTYNYLCVLRDKFYFGQLLSSLSFKVPRNIALINNGKLFWMQERGQSDLSSILDKDLDGFCKIIDGECGDEVFPLRVHRGEIFVKNEKISFPDFKVKIEKSVYLIQERIFQHSQMNRLYDRSINTIRLTTIYNPKTGDVDFLVATLRIGAHGSYVDNWAAGGLLIDINSEGKLAKYAFYKPGFGTKVTQHPDTGIIFENYQIPFFKEVVEEAINLHHYFYGVHSIGWDVAITETGPLFIEGNDNWEVAVQAASGGLKKRFLKYFD